MTLTASVTDDGYVLHGRKGPVEAGAQAEHLLVVGQHRRRSGAALVPAATAGVTVIPTEGLDLTRRYAEIHFDDVRVPRAAVVGDPSTAADAVERQLQLANVIQLHEMVGAMEKAFEITMEWMFNRYSFGRPLASYQELKHRCADMKAWIEVGHGIADAATRHVQDESDRAGEYTSAGKAYLGVYGVDVRAGLRADARRHRRDVRPRHAPVAPPRGGRLAALRDGVRSPPAAHDDVGAEGGRRA